MFDMNTYRVRKNAAFLLFMIIVGLYCTWYYLTTKQKINGKREITKLESQRLTPFPIHGDFRNWSHSKLAAFYHGYISWLQVSCETIIRLGEESDGGWNVCDDTLYRPVMDKKCLVYSFGINYDFSFDDAVATKYGCEVHSFDPSMNVKEGRRKPNVWFHPYGIGPKTEKLAGGWHLYTLRDIKKRLLQQNRTISFLKLDVEEWEMWSLPQMLSDGSLRDIKQLIVEIHITTRPEPNKERYMHGLYILKGLYELGFRIFWTKRNLYCRFTSLEGDIERTGCHEVSFLNINSVMLDGRYIRRHAS